jgi:DNA (cytosine-5)-methyltransferase 1
VVHDADEVVQFSIGALKADGYTVAHRTLNLSQLGVPQRRRRHVLLGVASGLLDPEAVLTDLGGCAEHPTRSVRWAIGDIEDPEGSDAFDQPSTPTTENASRMEWLFGHGRYDLPNSERPTCHKDKKHTYKSMYGRLRWDLPAQTVTTGFGSMGQGRYVHPSRKRTITPHEAARLQTFPDFFDFSPATGRTAWARMIGNAVPPLLACNIGSTVIAKIRTAAISEAA